MKTDIQIEEIHVFYGEDFLIINMGNYMIQHLFKDDHFIVRNFKLSNDERPGYEYKLIGGEVLEI